MGGSSNRFSEQDWTENSFFEPNFSKNRSFEQDGFNNHPFNSRRSVSEVDASGNLFESVCEGYKISFFDLNEQTLVSKNRFFKIQEYVI